MGVEKLETGRPRQFPVSLVQNRVNHTRSLLKSSLFYTRLTDHYFCTLFFYSLHCPLSTAHIPSPSPSSLSLHFQTLNSILIAFPLLRFSFLKFPNNPTPIIPFYPVSCPILYFSLLGFIEHRMNSAGRQISRSNPAVHHQRQHSDTAFDALCSYGRWAQPSNLSHVHSYTVPIVWLFLFPFLLQIVFLIYLSLRL